MNLYQYCCYCLDHFNPGLALDIFQYLITVPHVRCDVPNPQNSTPLPRQATSLHHNPHHWSSTQQYQPAKTTPTQDPRWSKPHATLNCCLCHWLSWHAANTPAPKSRRKNSPNWNSLPKSDAHIFDYASWWVCCHDYPCYSTWMNGKVFLLHQIDCRWFRFFLSLSLPIDFLLLCSQSWWYFDWGKTFDQLVIFAGESLSCHPRLMDAWLIPWWFHLGWLEYHLANQYQLHHTVLVRDHIAKARNAQYYAPLSVAAQNRSSYSRDSSS